MKLRNYKLLFLLFFIISCRINNSNSELLISWPKNYCDEYYYTFDEIIEYIKYSDTIIDGFIYNVKYSSLYDKPDFLRYFNGKYVGLNNENDGLPFYYNKPYVGQEWIHFIDTAKFFNKVISIEDSLYTPVGTYKNLVNIEITYFVKNQFVKSNIYLKYGVGLVGQTYMGKLEGYLVRRYKCK